MPTSNYDVVIERGRSELNNQIIDFLKTRIPRSTYLDVGCNTGWLLSEVPGGTGIDNSWELVNLCKKKNLNVILADAQKVWPFANNSFHTVVLSCVLQQTESPIEVIGEAMRVASQRVIGVTPYPGKSEWGRIGANKWTKSVLYPDKLEKYFNATIIPIDETHYYFEFKVRKNNKSNTFMRAKSI